MTNNIYQDLDLHGDLKLYENMDFVGSQGIGSRIGARMKTEIGMTAWPVGGVFWSANNVPPGATPAALQGGTWESTEPPVNTVTSVSRYTEYISCPVNAATTLMTITIPKGVWGVVTSLVDSSVADGSSIVYSRLFMDGLDLTARGTMSSGGGVTNSGIIAPADADRTLTLQTYNVRSVATSYRGVLQALFFTKTGYAWKRIA